MAYDRKYVCASQANGDCLDWIYKIGSDFDLIGMCSGSCWFKLVCDNSSKLLLAHFEQFFMKYQVDCSKLNPLYESLAVITYLVS